MASSRWKRFAFFDRKNLSLPQPVVNDLIPKSASGSSSSTSSRRGGRPGGGGGGDAVGPLDPQCLYPEESRREDCLRIGHGDYFSLVSALNVSIPSSLSSEGDGATQRGAGGDGAPAMQAGLVALHSAGALLPKSEGVSRIVRNEGPAMTNMDGGGELLLLFASSRNTSLVHCVDVTVRCTPTHLDREAARFAATSAVEGSNGVSKEGTKEGSKEGTVDAIAEELDGWRGHFDPFRTADGFLPKKKEPTPAPTKAPGRRSIAEQRILDEHLAPSNAGGGALFGSSPFEENKRARIVGLASCSSSLPTSRKRMSDMASVLFLASITDAPKSVGVTVHVNPHLMLSTMSPALVTTPSFAASSHKTVHSSFYKPSTGEFKYDQHGRPRCVSILPGVVCVGTDAGAVLIYVFSLELALACHNGEGNDIGGKLTLVAEIPAPRGAVVESGSNNVREKTSASSSSYAVSSVELIAPSEHNRNIHSTARKGTYDYLGSSTPNHNIHRLFVSYRRRIQSGSSTVSASKNISSSSNSTAMSMPSGPSGGVCCYDLGGLRIPGTPLPPGSSVNAPVVSARYDMDGRDVGSSCLCDVVSLPPMPPSSWMKQSDNDDKSHDEKGSKTETNNSSNNPKNLSSSWQEATAITSNNMEKMLPRFAVARGDGLHLYSPSEKVGVCPVEGNKIAVCSLPPPPVVYLKRPPKSTIKEGSNGGTDATTLLEGGRNDTVNGAGASYALVATTDSKAGRDAVDIYDTTNKLVGFHVLLSPGHRALRAVGIAACPTVHGGTLIRGGRSSAVVLTSGGSVVTLTEKVTPDKVSLLVQKNLYAAAISMAFSDPAFYRPEDITTLFRQYAEHLYRKGDFAAAMDQYILTIGSLESSHVIFRYLDAPKIPLVVKYLEALRAQGLASTVHDELLRTCYLKLNDHESAGKIALTSSSPSDDPATPSSDKPEAPTISISRNLLARADDPSEMLAAICSLEAPETAEALVAHGPMLARSLPRETAGVVIALCDGTYSPTALADAAAGRPAAKNNVCDKYPISLFANSFMENPKLFRLILSHCRRNDCVLTPLLRRTLLELTLDEWNAARQTGDNDLEKLRHDEALMILSENHVDDMGDYEALVIVQAAGFTDGEILLYERLDMVPMLLEMYARNGNERSRRQMLAMCERDPELFAEVLSHFVAMAGEKLNQECPGDASIDSETDVGGILRDIHEALVMARDHGDLPPVRIMRILAGEGFGQFSADSPDSKKSASHCSVPLSIAMDYVGAILDDSGKKIHRLKSNVEEYSRLCNDMETEINDLLSSGSTKKSHEAANGKKSLLPNVDIDEMYSNLRDLTEGTGGHQSDMGAEFGGQGSKEEFWRDMEQSDDPFETICFYISKGYLENI